MGVLLIGILFLHSRYRIWTESDALQQRREMVRILGLSDLCLFTEARYTRNPSLADIHTPFQDHPMSFEHFPSGSLVEPPPHWLQPSVN